MRPVSLYSLFNPISSLKGVGDYTTKLLKKFLGSHLIDLAFHLPINLEHRTFIQSPQDLKSGMLGTLIVTSYDIKPGRGSSPTRIMAQGNGFEVEICFFHLRGSQIQTTLPLGQPKVISGKIDQYLSHWQMLHPDHIGALGSEVFWQGHRPIYPLTAGLSSKILSRIIGQSLRNLPKLAEWLSEKTVTQYTLPPWKESLEKVHTPSTYDDLSPLSAPRRRLALDELMAHQVALTLIRKHQKRSGGRSLPGTGELKEKFLQILPFQLTSAQQGGIQEIAQDMASPSPMVRLLQGDVGSGKTVVAFMALLQGIESGVQGALLAPTEILARQHYETLRSWGEELSLKVELLTGRISAKMKKEIYGRLASGEIHIVVGTHALFQEGVTFKDLGIVVIDEQHRFGVEQRLALTSKGQTPDLLVMSATPIPRTLLLAAHGDMECTRLLEKPLGRKPIKTVVMPLSKEADVISGLRRAMEGGAKIYWVCPLIEESEEMDLQAAQSRFLELSGYFPHQVALVHGKLKGEEKEAALESFQTPGGDVKILVSTTVIEVGVDVKEATVMVIDHGERFGLAQLHQLRGRIGRNDKDSTCIILYGFPLSEVAQERLKVLRETNDGFKIAEMDLKLRGAGEVLGKRQSGMVPYRLTDLSVHDDLLEIAYEEAQLILKEDPQLTSPQGQAVKTLLYLFGFDQVIDHLRAG